MPKIAMRESRRTISLSSPTCFPLQLREIQADATACALDRLMAPESECGTGIVWQGPRPGAAGAASLKRMPGPVVSFPRPEQIELKPR